MAGFSYNDVQSVSLNQAAIFNTSIPCPRGNVFHADETGNFILRGNTQGCSNFARYQVFFNGNIAIPTGGTVGPIAVALSVNGETLPASRAIFTPAAVEAYGNVTSIATITVPRGCCFNVALRYVAASNDPAVVPTPVINLQNATLDITRTA